MNCVSCDICVYYLGLCVFFPGVFLSSKVTGACPVTTDLVMRVKVRTKPTYPRYSWCKCKTVCSICQGHVVARLVSPPLLSEAKEWVLQ